MSWKEQVFLLFCTLSVHTQYNHICQICQLKTFIIFSTPDYKNVLYIQTVSYSTDAHKQWLNTNIPVLSVCIGVCLKLYQLDFFSRPCYFDIEIINHLIFFSIVLMIADWFISKFLIYVFQHEWWEENGPDHWVSHYTPICHVLKYADRQINPPVVFVSCYFILCSGPKTTAPL